MLNTRVRIRIYDRWDRKLRREGEGGEERRNRFVRPVHTIVNVTSMDNLMSVNARIYATVPTLFYKIDTNEYQLRGSILATFPANNGNAFEKKIVEENHERLCSLIKVAIITKISSKSYHDYPLIKKLTFIR